MVGTSAGFCEASCLFLNDWAGAVVKGWRIFPRTVPISASLMEVSESESAVSIRLVFVRALLRCPLAAESLNDMVVQVCKI